MSALYNFHEMRVKKYFKRYKMIVQRKVEKAKHCRSIINKMRDVDLREGFKRWARFTQHTVFCEDMNQTGPITEYVFEANRTFHNLTEFMREEHYTPEEIAAKVEHVKEYNRFLLNNHIKKLQLPKEKRGIIKILNQLRSFVHTRKLFKYYLNYSNNSLQYARADMYWAFNKWR